MTEMKKEDLKIVFFGTPEFAVESLNALLENNFNIKAVVTMPDKIAGRGHKIIQSDVKKFALQKNIQVLQPERLKSEEFVDSLRRIEADLFIVIAFRMLPEIVWKMPRIGTFNLHASLLPKYRGAAPINWAVINGEKESGVTTFFLKHEIDTGDIIDSRKVEISDEDNVGILHDKLMKVGAQMVVETVNRILEGKLTTKPQPEGEFIAAPKIYKETCKIDWNNSAIKIHNLVRGLSPYPGAFSEIKDNRGMVSTIKIFETAVTDNNSLKPGEVKIENRKLFIGSGDKDVEIISLQPAGKKRMGAKEYLLGYTPDFLF